MIKVGFVGDIMPGGMLSGKETGYISSELSDYMNSFDLRIGTLESAMGDEIGFDPVKMEGKKSIIYSKDIDVQKLVGLKINAVSLANNHTFDLGEEGLKNTIELLERNNIVCFGAGMNASEAAAPAYLHFKNKKIGLLGYCSSSTGYGYLPVASETEAGVNLLDINTVVNDIEKLKPTCDYLFVLPHWGMEHTFFPPLECKLMAEKMIDAGADGVIGGHSHRVQPLSYYKKKPIYYSLGNFLFPDRYLQPPRPVWYPPADFDVSNLPETYGFPYVTEYTKKVWKELPRIGMVADVGLASKISAGYRLTYLEKTNRIDFFRKEKKLKKLLQAASLLTVSRLYVYEKKVRKMYSFSRRKLSSIMRRS